MMSDELKHEHTFYWDDCYAVYCGVCGLKIADDALLDQIGEMYKTQADYNSVCIRNLEMQAEITRLRKQVEVLKAALQDIDQSACYPADVQPDLPPGNLWALIDRIHDIAYKAMKGGQQ